MKKVVTLMLLVLVLIVVTGCNTMRGLGKDIKKAGEKLEDAAR